MYMKVSRLLFGLATVGTLSFAGFLILYWQKKKREKAIEDDLKGGNRKKVGKKTPSSLPPRTGGTESTTVAADGDGINVETDKSKKALQKEELEKIEAVELSSNSRDSTNPNSSRRIQERSINLEIRIAKDDLDSIIGKGGINIRRIQKETNTRISQRGEALENGDRIYTITGNPDAVGLTESKIKKIITSKPVLNKFVMQVPEHTMGRIIGREGETIRGLQDVTQTRIVVEQKSTTDDDKLFTDDAYEAPKREEGNLKTVTIRGTDERIAHARKLISDIIQEDATLRERILDSTRKRTQRIPKKSNANENNSSTTVVPISRDDASLPLRQDKTIEVFISCVYHPNEFYFQHVNHETIQLDKLCDSMTDYYKQHPRSKGGEGSFAVGDNVAAPFADDRIYRAQILNVEGETADIRYIDYGDKRQVKISDLRKIKPEFLKLKFQATLATLNLECLEERWTDEAIDETVELTKCATWDRMKAKVLGYLKEPSDSTRDIIWVEIYDAQDKNIADTLINKGLAGLKRDPPPLSIATAPIVTNTTNVAPPSANGVSYATMAAAGSSNNT